MKMKVTTVHWWAVLSHGELSMTVAGGVQARGSFGVFSYHYIFFYFDSPVSNSLCYCFVRN